MDSLSLDEILFLEMDVDDLEEAMMGPSNIGDETLDFMLGLE